MQLWPHLTQPLISDGTRYLEIVSCPHLNLKTLDLGINEDRPSL